MPEGSKGNKKAKIIEKIAILNDRHPKGWQINQLAELTGIENKNLSCVLVAAHKYGFLHYVRTMRIYSPIEGKDINDLLYLSMKGNGKVEKRPATPIVSTDIIKTFEERFAEFMDYVRELEAEVMKYRQKEQDEMDFRDWVNRTCQKIPEAKDFRVPLTTP